MKGQSAIRKAKRSRKPSQPSLTATRSSSAVATCRGAARRRAQFVIGWLVFTAGSDRVPSMNCVAASFVHVTKSRRSSNLASILAKTNLCIKPQASSVTRGKDIEQGIKISQNFPKFTKNSRPSEMGLAQRPHTNRINVP